MLRYEKVAAMHGNAVVSRVVIRHAYGVPDSGDSQASNADVCNASHALW